MFINIRHQFQKSLQREAVTIHINEKTIPAVCRRVRDSRDGGDWIDLYFPFGNDTAEVGNIAEINGNDYLIVTRDHRKNEIYERYNCVRCNQRIQLIELTQGKPDKYGDIPLIESVYFESPVYAVTELQDLIKTAIGYATGGYETILMPAAKLNLNTAIKLKTFNSNNNLVFEQYKISSLDTTDVLEDESGALHGILRLQVPM